MLNVDSIHEIEMPVLNITAQLLENPPPIPAGRRYVSLWDTKQRGFCVVVGKTCATFKVRCFDFRRREHTIKIGRYGDVTLAQARRRAAELRAQYALGQDPAAELRRLRQIPTVASFVEDRLMPHVRERLRSTVTYAAFARRLVAAFGNRHLDEVTVQDIAAFRASLIREGLAPASVNRHLAFARMAFSRAIKWGLVAGPNPAASPGMLPEQARDRYLSDAEARALVAALGREADRTAATAIGLLMLTGARRGEVLGARFRDLDFDRKVLFVPRAKSGRPHHVRLSAAAIELLQQHRDRLSEAGMDDYVFPGRRPGRPLHDLRGAWQRVKQDAGLPADLRLHDLRHSFASNLANRGVPLHEIAVLLGHRQLSTTSRYAHHSAARLNETVQFASSAWTPAPEDHEATTDHGDVR